MRKKYSWLFWLERKRITSKIQVLRRGIWNKKCLIHYDFLLDYTIYSLVVHTARLKM